MAKLEDIDIDFISLVDEGANQRGVILAKSKKGVGNVAVVKQTETKNETQSGMIESLANSVVEKMKNIFMIEKGAVQEKYDMYAKNSNIWNAWDAFTNSIRRYDSFSHEYAYETDGAKIRAAIEEFSVILNDVLAKSDDEISDMIMEKKEVVEDTEITKAGKKMSGKNMTKLQTAYELIGELVAENSDVADTNVEVETVEVEEEVEKMDDKDVEIEKMKQEIAMLKMARGVSNQMTTDLEKSLSISKHSHHSFADFLKKL